MQDVIEHRLKAVFGRDIRIHGSGRTDAGVHALGQVFHFDAEWTHGAEKLRKALQSRLPQAVLLKKLRAGKPGFHSRFDAKGKVYRYDLYLGEPDPFTAPFCWALNRPLDIPAMNAAAAVLPGKHDFKAFSADNGSSLEEAEVDRLAYADGSCAHSVVPELRRSVGVRAAPTQTSPASEFVASALPLQFAAAALGVRIDYKALPRA